MPLGVSRSNGPIALRCPRDKKPTPTTRLEQSAPLVKPKPIEKPLVNARLRTRPAAIAIRGSAPRASLVALRPRSTSWLGRESHAGHGGLTPANGALVIIIGTGGSNKAKSNDRFSLQASAARAKQPNNGSWQATSRVSQHRRGPTMYACRTQFNLNLRAHREAKHDDCEAGRRPAEAVKKSWDEQRRGRRKANAQAGQRPASHRWHRFGMQPSKRAINDEVAGETYQPAHVHRLRGV
jgi:hypothetical protein